MHSGTNQTLARQRPDPIVDKVTVGGFANLEAVAALNSYFCRHVCLIHYIEVSIVVPRPECGKHKRVEKEAKKEQHHKEHTMHDD